ncbi:pectate lyase family protein [Catenuloplanes indicus]|uniref:Pectate lyase domain-containing protein n=1 Tax=Catenuloplanes indicus TaxID=137267 RepID=A0AAE4AZY1_9ACTN|nr:hypothetical protein [Catenuloplanes indicus]MDQ0368974.1 hypothetical protein [Catenuloplanes indicus]
MNGAGLVTVSWNHFDHSDKSMLISHSDGAAGTDVGHLRVSIHHNWFDHGRQRHPRVRFGEPVHVYNTVVEPSTYDSYTPDAPASLPAPAPATAASDDRGTPAPYPRMLLAHQRCGCAGFTEKKPKGQFPRIRSVRR